MSDLNGKRPLPFVILLLFLLFRPQGFLRKKVKAAML
jgi:branched-subunit amino acid ABC-type transport system permease component